MVPPTCSWGKPPPCTSHCRLSADGLLASSSLFPNKYQPFFHKNPVVSLAILSGSLLGSLLLILLFGSPSPHLLVPLPAHIPPTPLPFFPSPTSPACLLLDILLAWYTLFPPYILEANATDSQRCMTVSRGYSPPFCSSGVIHPLSFPLLSLPPLYPDLSLYVL